MRDIVPLFDPCIAIVPVVGLLFAYPAAQKGQIWLT
jgi:hypothetical protein